MLPPFIIEQIRQREAQERQRREATRPRLELPIERPPRDPEETDDRELEVERGVVVLDM